jgi:hypothetical protein
MAEAIAPIETFYKGIRFRSRLEARWAVFFDVLGIKYLYEPEKYQVGPSRYIPDFFLPDLGDDHHAPKDEPLTSPGIFVEIKGAAPTTEEMMKARSLSRQTDRNISIFHGSSMTTGLEWWPIVLEQPLPCFFSQCPFCGRFGISTTALEDGQAIGTGSVHRHACMEEHKIGEQYDVFNYCCQDLKVTPSSPALDIAYEAARSMRFEDRLSAERVSACKRAVQALFNSRTYCNPDVTETIIKTAMEWKAAGDFMHYDGAPWWVQHRLDYEAGVSPCTCYSCVYDRMQKTAVH